jgi:hypothetical protein
VEPLESRDLLTSYLVHDLGAGSTATGLSSRGWISGYGPGGEGFIWTRGSFAWVPDFKPNAINDHGVVLGDEKTWQIGDPNSKYTDLNNGHDINNQNVVVGNYVTGGTGGPPAWAADGVAHVIPVNADGMATGINDSGLIVGYYYTNVPGVRGFLYDGKTVEEVVGMDGPVTYVVGMSNSGYIVGYGNKGQICDNGDCYYHGFLAGANGGLIADYGQKTNAVAVNDYGDVIGTDAAGWWIAFGTGTDRKYLNASVPAGWTIENAVGINDKGFIAANATGPDGKPHGVLLLPQSDMPAPPPRSPELPAPVDAARVDTVAARPAERPAGLDAGARPLVQTVPARRLARPASEPISEEMFSCHL